MGVDLSVFEFLINLAGEDLGDTLCLGRQGFHIPRDGAQWERAQQLLSLRSTGTALSDLVGRDGFSEPLFKFLGARGVRSLDISAYEGADIVHDLNEPISPDLHERFDCIFDGGTLEHVYDLPTAVFSVQAMLRSGGLFVGVNPANNYLGHGFYQFSPELFWRIWSPENGFVIERMQLAPVDGIAQSVELTDPAGIRQEIARTDYPTYIMVAARRIQKRNTGKASAYQSDYVVAWRAGNVRHKPPEGAMFGRPRTGGERRVRFGRGGDSREFEVEGWSYPEDGYTWALGPKATLALPVPHDAAVLEITGQPALRPLITSQRISVSANGADCGEYSLSEFGIITFQIPAVAVRDSDQLRITLTLPDAFRPNEFSENPDSRLLALAVSEIAIKIAAEDSSDVVDTNLAEGVTVAHDNRQLEDLAPIVLVQTADPSRYKEMLDLTARVNALYCARHGFKYMSYVGIKHGVAPWQATYNRIFIFNELVQDGFNGWVAYLDADAFVTDLAFDLRAYLRENSSYCLIGAPGGDAEWNINAGVLFLNLGEPTGAALVSDWLGRFRASVPAAYLADPNAVWDDFPNDQVLLHQCVQLNPVLFAKTKKEQSGIFNYVDGGFVRQAIRESFYDLAERVRWVRSETDRIMARETRSIGYRDLTELADQYGSDKGDLVGNQHGYTHIYEFLFEGFREDSFEFLEIGLLRGGPETGGPLDRQGTDLPSVRMWLDYFPRAYCHGLDISDFGAIRLDRFRFHRGDLGNPEDLARVRSDLPKQLRFIVDDGSHASYHQQLAFTHLFGLVERGGYYIIEDLDWQPEEYERLLPKCVLTRDVFLGFLRDGLLEIAFLPTPERDALADQIGHVLVHRRRSDGVVKMIAIQRG